MTHCGKDRGIPCNNCPAFQDSYRVDPLSPNEALQRMEASGARDGSHDPGSSYEILVPVECGECGVDGDVRVTVVDRGPGVVDIYDPFPDSE